MTTFEPAYRARVYKPRSIDSTETRLLYAAPDYFLISTLPEFTDGVGTWKPYLEQIRGRRGAIEPLSKKMDTGRLDITVFDVRLNPSSNAERWLTKFFGGADNLVQLIGCKIYVEESLDGGSTWGSHFTGRITSPRSKSKIQIVLSCRDMSDDYQNNQIFQLPPHESASYAAMARLAPIGLPIQYGGYGARPLLRGKTGIPNPFSPDLSTVKIVVTTDYDGYNATDNIMTSYYPGLRSSENEYTSEGHEYMRARVTLLSGPNSGNTYVYQVKAVKGESSLMRLGGSSWDITNAIIVPKLDYIYVDEVDPSDPEYGELSRLQHLYDVEFEVYMQLPAWWYLSEVLQTDTVKPLPIVIGDVDPRQLLKDILDGYFGARFVPEFHSLPSGSNWGDPITTVPYNESSIDSLSFGISASIVDNFNTDLVARGIVVEPAEALEWVQKNLLDPLNWVCYFDKDGVLTFFDLKDKRAGEVTTTITNADLTPNGYQQSIDATKGITHISQHVYYDQYLNATPNGFREIKWDTVSPTLIVTRGNVVPYINLRALDMGRITREVKSDVLRIPPESERVWINTQNVVSANINRILKWYEIGPMYHSVQCRRNTTTNALVLGSSVVLDIDEIMDPHTNLRGGARIGICTEIIENGPTIGMKFLDIGDNANASTPYSGSLVVHPNDARHGIRIERFGSQIVSGSKISIWTATTDKTTGARPTDSGSWYEKYNRKTSWGPFYTASFGGNPSGVRMWAKLRSEYDYGGSALPSDWVYPENDYIDLPTLPQPGTITTSDITGGTCTLTWTNPAGAEYGLVEVKLDGATSASANVERVALLPSLSTEYEIVGTVTSSDYTAAIRYIDSGDLGGVGPYRVKEFTSSGSYAQCPRPAEFIAL